MTIVFRDTSIGNWCQLDPPPPIVRRSTHLYGTYIRLIITIIIFIYIILNIWVCAWDLYSQRSMLETWNVRSRKYWNWWCTIRVALRKQRRWSVTAKLILRLCFRLCRLLVSSCGGSYSVLPSKCPIIIGTFRPISIKKRMGNRVYSAAHVSSLTIGNFTEHTQRISSRFSRKL